MNEKINSIIEEISPSGGRINEKSKLKDDLGIDSLRLVELLLALENEFSIEFALSDMDVKKFYVVTDVYTLIAKYIR